MKLGIFGGSFNPVQKGHTRLANYIVSSGVVDMVLMMPCYKSLYNKELLDGETRLKMIELADRLPHVQPFDWEIKNKIEGLGTYDIMKMLEGYFENRHIGLIKEDDKLKLYDMEIIGSFGPRLPDEIYFIIGLDNSQKVKSWLNGDKIINELKFIVVPRNGVNTNDIWFMDSPHIWLNKYEGDDVSSSGVKELLRNGGDLEHHLDKSVKDYIITNQLYGS